MSSPRAHLPSPAARFGDFVFALSFLLGMSAFAVADDARPLDQVRRLEISPKTISLGGINRQQQIVVTAILKDGRKLDVTDVAAFSSDNTATAYMEGSIVRGRRDGRALVKIQCGPASAEVSVVAVQYAAYPRLDFRNDIMPILAKLGCNSGGCHGKQGGQNGFQLSVFGFDPPTDFDALVKQGRGRRIFPAAAEKSLLIAKAIGRVPHGGGQRTTSASLDAERLVQWIKQGTPWASSKSRQLKAIQIFPNDRVIPPKSSQQLLVTAIYSDGSRRDVTTAAAYTSNTQVVAQVDQRGKVQSGQVAGEAAITINYMGRVGVARFIVPRIWSAPVVVSASKRGQPIDRYVDEKLARLQVKPSGRCDDMTFLRRLYLVTIGTLPTSQELVKFQADQRSDKRSRAIEDVLRREEFNDYWTVNWADILMVDPKKIGERGAYQFHHWLRRQIKTNRPYDEWVRELITATGNSAKYGPVNLYRAQRTPEGLTKTISQAFLGIRLDCAQCHHHPFEKWSQDDFYGMAGYFTGLQRKSFGTQREFVFHPGHQPAKMPLTQKVVKTRPPDGPLLDRDASGDPRIALANWMTSPDNRYFKRLVANRIWKQLMGRGLFEPEDDLRSTNPATNEPLLDYLAEQVVHSKYDLRAVMKLILKSETFQRSSVPNETNFDDQQNFSHYGRRRLSAHVLLDAISQVTNSPERFAGYSKGTRAAQLWDNRLPSYFLDTFGRSLRESPCACGKSDEPTMAQALHLMNAPEIQAKIEDPAGRVAILIKSAAKPDTMVEQLCLAALGRPANAREKKVATRLFAELPKKKAAEDFLWALLNSYDFLFVH